MRTALTDDQFSEQLDTFHSAFRMEVKAAYSVVGERRMYAKFLAGQPPTVDADDEYYRDWLEDVAKRTAAGATLIRVRISDQPPTEYQRFLRWSDHLNRDAGETIHYLNRAEALAKGIPAEPADPDWWILDDKRLLVITHDGTGRRIRAEIDTTDKALHQARSWRDLAIRTARKEPE